MPSSNTAQAQDELSETVTSEVTQEQREPLKPWLVQYRFQQGNPGRKKGARNRLAEEFISDLEDDWKEHGIQVIQEVRETRPQDYLKVIAMLMPKDINFRLSQYDELTDEQLRERLVRFSDLIATLTSGYTGSAGNSGPDAAPSADAPIVHALPGPGTAAA
jgi:hypothetical protein